VDMKEFDTLSRRYVVKDSIKELRWY